MGNQVVTLAKKKVLILSDNDSLSRAIELNLNSRLAVTIIKLASELPDEWKPQASVNDFDLIILAMSSPTSEPIVALARASLVKRIGYIPLLIISDRPFDAEPEHHITHLDFPFDIDNLCSTVDGILQRRAM